MKNLMILVAVFLMISCDKSYEYDASNNVTYSCVVEYDLNKAPVEEDFEASKSTIVIYDNLCISVNLPNFNHTNSRMMGGRHFKVGNYSFSVSLDRSTLEGKVVENGVHVANIFGIANYDN